MKTFTKNYTGTVSRRVRALPALCLTSLSYINAAEDPSWEFPLHSHPEEAEIAVILAGRAQLYWEGRRYEMREGDVVIKRPGTLHAEKSDHTDPVEQICLSFRMSSGAFPDDFPAGTEDDPLLRTDLYPLLADVSRRIRDLAASSEGNDMETDALCRAFWEMLLCACSARRLPKNAGRDNRLVEEARSYIDLHFTEKITVKMLSDRYHVDPYHLEHIFTKYTGYSIRQYQISRRIGEAQRLLIFSGESIKSIAASCGYSNLQYFYTAFRRQSGCTPAEFKSRYL